ncbi:MAG: AsmA family protein [Phycisphaerae bacterium]|nr:AsmA family protein [Phycisphaerae bacterium]
MKKLSRIIASIVVLLILAVVLVVLLIDPIAKSGVEKGAAYALGVETTVDSVDVRLLDGQVIMKHLNIANPEGFDSPRLAHMGRFDIQLDPGSLFSDPVQIRKFELDGLELHIEQKLGGSNVAKIMDNIKRLSKDKEASEGPSKKVNVELVVIKNVQAHFHLLAGPGLTVEVPKIELRDLSSEDSGGVAGQLASQLFPAVLAAVFQQAQGVVPADFLKELDSQVLDLANEAAQEVEKALEKIGLDEAVKDAGKGLEKGLGELGESLFGPKKEQSDTAE